MPVLRAPCFPAAVDVVGSVATAAYTAPMKFVEQVSRARQSVHSMHGNDVVRTVARVEWYACSLSLSSLFIILCDVFFLFRLYYD